MKTAICIYGMYREFSNCVKSWKFLKHLDYDIYFSTYDYTFERNAKLGTNIFETVTEEQITKLLPTSGAITINMENKNNLFLNSLHNSDKMIYHWKKCWDMLQQSEIAYDKVYLIRPDLFLENNTETILPALDCSVNNILYGGRVAQFPPPTYLSTLDMLFIGNPQTIGKLIDGINFISDYTRFFEYHLAKCLINNDIYISPLSDINIIYTVARSNSRYLIDINTPDKFDQIFIRILGNLTEKFSQTHTAEDSILPFGVMI